MLMRRHPVLILFWGLAFLICFNLAAPFILFSQSKNAVEDRLYEIQSHQATMLAQQQVILDQLKMVLDIRKQVFTNTEDLHNAIERVSKLETRLAELGDQPVSIAILQTKVDGIARVGLWTFAALGTAMIGGIWWAFRQIKTAVDIKALAKATHRSVMESLTEAKDASQAAFAAANSVNEKIASVGLRPLDEQK